MLLPDARPVAMVWYRAMDMTFWLPQVEFGAAPSCRYLWTRRKMCFKMPLHSPNLNAYAERWARSVKEETLSRLILFGERSLRQALTEYMTHFHQERPHQGKGNLILIPAANHRQQSERPIRCYKRLGGLLSYYDREAA
jgi:Integrase core domain